MPGRRPFSLSGHEEFCPRFVACKLVIFYLSGRLHWHGRRSADLSLASGDLRAWLSGPFLQNRHGESISLGMNTFFSKYYYRSPFPIWFDETVEKAEITVFTTAGFSVKLRSGPAFFRRVYHSKANASKPMNIHRVFLLINLIQWQNRKKHLTKSKKSNSG